MSPNLCRSDGRRPSHITLGTVRLWASKDMACGDTKLPPHTPPQPLTTRTTKPLKYPQNMHGKATKGEEKSPTHHRSILVDDHDFNPWVLQKHTETLCNHWHTRAITPRNVERRLEGKWSWTRVPCHATEKKKKKKAPAVRRLGE